MILTLVYECLCPNATLEDFLWETLEFYAGSITQILNYGTHVRVKIYFSVFSVKSSDFLPNVL